MQLYGGYYSGKTRPSMLSLDERDSHRLKLDRKREIEMVGEEREREIWRGFKRGF